MHRICARLYLFPQCTIYVQYLHKIVLISLIHNICTRFAQDCTYFPNEKDLCKIVLLSLMHNICTRFAQDCSYFSNVQYMCKIVLISPMCNICTRFAQDCTSPPQCAIIAQDCRHYWEKYVTHHISALNLEWYPLHCYFWIATSSYFFLNKHL